MIRQKAFFSAVFLIAIFIAACSGKKDHHNGHTEEHAASADSWEEMDEFHMVMAESFHPFKDSSNLEPAKANAAAMASSAKKWVSAPLPNRVDSDETKEKLQQLERDAAAFVETAKTGDDKLIGESLTKLHDLFHALQEAWYGGHDAHKEQD